jgi:hypothetical protein
MSRVGAKVSFKYPSDEGDKHGKLKRRTVIPGRNAPGKVPYWDVVDLIEFEGEKEPWLRIGYYRKPSKKKLTWGSQTTIAEPISTWKRILVSAANDQKWFRELLQEVAAKKEDVMKVYSYVVEHDNGYAPNPYFRFCTLCGCKFEGGKNIVQLAKEGDWIIGTGGANLKRSAGHGKLVYAMRVDEKLTRSEYFTDSQFEQKKPVKTGNYKQRHGDNEDPRYDVKEHKDFALVSRHFYYLGANAIDIPEGFKNFEKKGPMFRYVDSADFCRFIEWLKTKYKPGIHGEPCGKVVDELNGSNRCKSSC